MHWLRLLKQLPESRKDQLFRTGLSILLVLSFFLRLYRLDQPTEHYFDEVYHAYTAQKYLHNNPEAYDIWSPPEGRFANEWVHPPLAKLLMAGFMAITHESSFGWRIGSSFFGTGIIAVTALIALQLFRSKKIAALAAVFLSLDGLLLAQSRIAMNDTYFLFFGLCSIYTYILWRKNHQSLRTVLLSGVFFGLALASKWTSLYILLFYATDILFRLKRKEFKLTPILIIHGILSFLFVPFALYLASYAQFFALGYSWKDLLEMQRQIFWYHTNLVATHPYQSTPVQWILDLRPVWYWTGDPNRSFVQNIYNAGNPIFFWFGLIAIAFSIRSLIHTKNSVLLFCILWYFWMWLPWARSPRIMFFYHYLPALPPLAILSAYFAEHLLHIRAKIQTKNRQLHVVRLTRAIPFAVIGLCALWLMLFFPILTGLPIPREYDRALFSLFPFWR